MRRALGAAARAALVAGAAGAALLAFPEAWLDGRLPSGRTIAVPGLAGEVRIDRDAHGVVHVHAVNERDAWAGLGFAMAEDRAGQVERRLAATAARDPGGRRPARDAAEGARIAAFVAGAGARLAHGPRPTSHRLALARPRPWTAAGVAGLVADACAAAADVGRTRVVDVPAARSASGGRLVGWARTGPAGELPADLYPAHLVGGGLDVVGLFVPGTPLVVAARTSDAVWLEPPGCADLAEVEVETVAPRADAPDRPVELDDVRLALGDVEDRAAAALVPALVAAAAGDAELADGVRALTAWSGRCDRESAGCALFALAAERLATGDPPREALHAAHAELTAALGASPDGWAWGSLLRIELRAPESDVPVVGRWFRRGPYAYPGTARTPAPAPYVRHAAGRPGERRVVAAATARFVVDLAEPEVLWVAAAGPPAELPLDRTLDAWLDPWLAGGLLAVRRTAPEPSTWRVTLEP